MSGAQIIMQVLADEGVDAIFGYSGGAILPTYDAILTFNEEQQAAGRAQIPLIVPANEQGAGFMAAGYARASGRVGVCMVTSGPGATNTVTPVRDCAADSIPIVVICGQVPTAAIGSDAFQEAPVAAIMGSVAKHVFLVTDPTRLEITVRTAFEIARTGRPGPVVIDIPKDVQNWNGVFQGKGSLPIPGYRHRLAELQANTLTAEHADEFLRLLGEAQRPLIYAGGGVINGGASPETAIICPPASAESTPLAGSNRHSAELPSPAGARRMPLVALLHDPAPLHPTAVLAAGSSEGMTGNHSGATGCTAYCIVLAATVCATPGTERRYATIASASASLRFANW